MISSPVKKKPAKLFGLGGVAFSQFKLGVISPKAQVIFFIHQKIIFKSLILLGVLDEYKI
jgi:hypothetical protein